MRGLHQAYRDGGRAQDLEIYPNLWAGVGLVRGGAGTALVGSHAEVADRIEEYASLGIEEFIMSGYPHLEEAYWFGEGVLPELRSRGATPVQADTVPANTLQADTVPADNESAGRVPADPAPANPVSAARTSVLAASTTAG